MTFFKQLSLQLNFVFKSLFFLQYIPHAFFYSLKRDRLQRQYLTDSSANPVIQPGKLLQAKTIDRGAYFYFEQAELEISCLTWAIASDALSVTVGVDGSLKFCDRTGQTLRAEQPPQRQGEKWVHQAQLRSEECIYGLGERASSLNLRAAKDELQKPKTYQMWNRDPGGRYAPGTDPIYICIPVYLGLHDGGSYLIFYENSFQADIMSVELTRN